MHRRAPQPKPRHAGRVAYGGAGFISALSWRVCDSFPSDLPSISNVRPCPRCPHWRTFPKITGFFSYSREDDEAFEGAVSALGDAIQRELSAQLGRSRTNF